MPSRRPTLLDVARAAGVSRSTVSYAYNQPERLSDDTRARVLAAAREVGYAGPNPLRASLRRGRAGAIGVLITERLSYAFDDPGAGLFLRGIASAGEDADVGLTLLPPAPVGPGALAAVRGSAVDGVIAFSLPPQHAAIRAAVERRLPLVRVDMSAPAGEPVVRSTTAAAPAPSPSTCSPSAIAASRCSSTACSTTTPAASPPPRGSRTRCSPSPASGWRAMPTPSPQRDSTRPPSRSSRPRATRSRPGRPRPPSCSPGRSRRPR